MSGSDPVRDLNNYLQTPNNLTGLLRFTSQQSGPNNQAIHTGTYAFRGVIVGTGNGTTIAASRRIAATQALQYFHAHGIPE